MWQGFGNLIGARKGPKPGSKPLTTIEQRCPVCRNALDPRWSKCPYCEAAKNAGNKSSRVVPEPAKAVEPAPRAATLVDGGAFAQPVGPDPMSMAAAAGSGRRHTIVDPAPGGALGVERHAGGGRRLTGIVTSFTWSRLGQLFEVRDGRNYAGSGVVIADNNSPCEILMSEDRTMSSAHFLILCQAGKYIISDNFSVNGTFVNGVQIDTRGVDLPDDAVIKAGSTVFTFQKVHSLAGAPPEPAPPVEPAWKRDDPEERLR